MKRAALPSARAQMCWVLGGRGWEIRHAQDQGVPTERLRKLNTLEELEELVRCDAYGVYRPLRSEGNLIAGWLYEARDEKDFREAIEVVYPGLWGNAEAWKKKTFRFDSWEASLARQTTRVQKMAAQSADLPQRIVQAQCKKRCLKRVIWAGETMEDNQNQVPMLCTGPCGMFWSSLRD